MIDNTVFILGLFVVGLVLILVEMIVPGVIIGLTGACMVIGAIVMAYSDGPSLLGHTLLGISIAFVPLFFFIWVRVLAVFMTRKERIVATATPQGRQELEGKEGVTLTTLRPAGAARIDGQRVDVMARGEIIEANTRIQVVAVEGNRVVVREVRA